MNKHTLLLIAAAVAGMQACSNGPDRSVTDNTAMNTDTAKMATVQAAPSAMAMSDTAFANKAAIGGMAEVAMGKMAAGKASDPKVKDFGNMMVSDHGKANDELKSIASSKNMQLPTDLDAKHKALSDSLGNFSGKAFDVAYVNTMLEDHKKDLAMFQAEAANGSDADIKAFAAKTADMIQMHLNKIQAIHDGMK